MAEPKLQFPDESLPDIERLLSIADVTEDDVTAANQEWKDNPPDPEFELILEAISLRDAEATNSGT